MDVSSLSILCYLGEDLLPLPLVAQSVPPDEVRLELQAALLKRMLDRLLDLLGVLSDVLLARALPPTGATTAAKNYRTHNILTQGMILQLSLLIGTNSIRWIFETAVMWARRWKALICRHCFVFFKGVFSVAWRGDPASDLSSASPSSKGALSPIL